MSPLSKTPYRRRGREYHNLILGWLPVSGEPIRAKDLFAKAKNQGIGKPTVVRHLRQAERDFLIVREKSGNAVTYRKDPRWSLPFDPRELFELELKYGPFKYRIPGHPGYFKWFVEATLAGMDGTLRLLLVAITRAKSKVAARNYAIWVLDSVIAPEIRALAEAAWTERKFASDILLDITWRKPPEPKKVVDM